MKLHGIAALVVLVSAVPACAPGQAPGSPTESAPSKGTVLVDRLPDGVEGLEIKDGALAAKAGYGLMKGSNATFVVVRELDGQIVSAGGCGCSGGGGACEPKLEGGIAVCHSDGCLSCGLAVTAGSVRTEIIRY